MPAFIPSPRTLTESRDAELLQEIDSRNIIKIIFVRNFALLGHHYNNNTLLAHCNFSRNENQPYFYSLVAEIIVHETIAHYLSPNKDIIPFNNIYFPFLGLKKCEHDAIRSRQGVESHLQVGSTIASFGRVESADRRQSARRRRDGADKISKCGRHCLLFRLLSRLTVAHAS
jgi:hypothetical protein